MQSDEVILALTPPLSPPPPPPPPRKQSKAAKENVERYKRLYDATLQDILSVLKADDPSADIILPDPSADAIIARSNENSHENVLELLFREPPDIKRGLDAPLSPLNPKSDDFLPHAIARQQSQHTLSDDSTVVIDFKNECHDIKNLLSDSNGVIPEDVLFPVANKIRIRSSPTSNFRQPRKDDGKKRRSKSGGDRRKQKVPSSASISKPRKRPNGKSKKKRPESMQTQLQRQSSQSKSEFARSARGRSASPLNDDEGAAIAVFRSTE